MGKTVGELSKYLDKSNKNLECKNKIAKKLKRMRALQKAGVHNEFLANNTSELFFKDISWHISFFHALLQ